MSDMPVEELSAITFWSVFYKPVLVLNQAGKIVYANPSFCDTTGFVSEEILGTELSVVTEGYQPNELTNGKTVSMKLKHKTSDVSENRVFVSIIYLKNSEQFTVLTLDEESRNHFEIEEKYKYLSEQTEQFTHVLSHDLQATLRVISSFIKLQSDAIKSGNEKMIEEFTSYINDSVKKMHALLDGLLKVAKVGRRVLNLSSVDMQRVMSEVVASKQSDISKTGTSVLFRDLPVVKADEVLVKQLLMEIVDNAIKFRYEEIQPVLELSVKEINDCYEFSLKDNGIGIDPKFKERIFVVFQRLHNNSDYPGDGVGLAVCRAIINKLGCKIWVESEKDKGAIFKFTLNKSQ